MTRHLLTTAEFGAAVREGQQPEAMVIGFGETKAAPDSADGATAADFVYSDGGIDHQNDTINVQGWDTSVFARNPTALWAHDATSPTVGKSSSHRRGLPTATNLRLRIPKSLTF